MGAGYPFQPGPGETYCSCACVHLCLLETYTAVNLPPITDAWMDPMDGLVRLPFGSPMLPVGTDPSFSSISAKVSGAVGRPHEWFWYCLWHSGPAGQCLSGGYSHPWDLRCSWLSPGVAVNPGFALAVGSDLWAKHYGDWPAALQELVPMASPKWTAWPWALISP